jgi:predicted Zn finger-like uncharacterized protein
MGCKGGWALTVECSGCRKRYRIGDHLAGKRVRCRNCAQTILVQPVEVEIEVEEADQPRHDPFADDDAPYGTPIGLAGESDDDPYANAAPAPAPAPAQQTLKVTAPTPDTQSLRSFHQRFKDKRQALTAFARARAMTYAFNRVDRRCCCCKREGDFTIHEVPWRAGLGNSFSFHWISLITIWFGAFLYRTGPTEFIEFRTYHRICGACKATSAAIGLVGAIGWVISVFLLVLALVLIVIGLTNPGSAMHRGGSSQVTMVGFVLLLLSIPGMIFLRRLQTPSGMRGVAPSPFVRGKMRRL